MKYKKGTFIVIPNKDNLKGKPSEMQTLYFWLCCFANDEGQCFPSRTTLAKVCNFSSLRTVDKYLDMLIEEGFIGKTKRKRKGSKSYISNLYQVRVLNAPPSASDDTTPSAPNSTITVSNINSIHLTDKSVDKTTEIGIKKKSKKQLREETPFSFKVELDKLGDSNWKPHKILYNYFVRKKLVFENYKQFDGGVGRFIKQAQQLDGYTSKQINDTMDYCDKNFKDYGWTLNAVVKNIAEVVNRK